MRADKSQPGNPFVLSLDVKMMTRKGILLRTVNVEGADSHFDFDVPDDLVAVQLDPDHKFLIWRPEYGAPPKSLH